jgi:hypothetical protein
MGKAKLTYYLFEGILTGTVAGKFVHLQARSGGGGGTTSEAGANDPAAANNPYRTGQRQQAGVRGGPIPPGGYAIKCPAKWHGGRAARLEPAVSAGFQEWTGRTGGFLIHGSGPLGSDGCIVPLNCAQFRTLMDGLERDDGGTLTVLEAMRGDRFA